MREQVELGINNGQITAYEGNHACVACYDVWVIGEVQEDTTQNKISVVQARFNVLR